jgi:hypothetical protein
MILSLQKESALNKSHPHENDQLVSIILQSTFFFWIITKLSCWKLWTTNRIFPTAPPFDFLVVPPLVHVCLLAISLGLMLILIFNSGSKVLLTALLITELLACLFDQSRWMPWEYQFVFLVFITLINRGDNKKIINSYLLIVIATYAYSGLGKFNSSFLYLFWDNLLLRRFFKMDPAVIHKTAIYYSGYLVALIELVFGIGLCFLKTQKAAAWAIIVMHVFILFLVGPFGLKYNSSVWPWNVLMIVQVYFLFIKNTGFTINLRLLWGGWNKLVLICWGLLPLLNHTLGRWDNFLSLRLFTGTQPMMVFCIKDSAEIKQLQPFLEKADNYQLCNGEAIVNLQSWSMKEMNSPIYTEQRVYEKVAERWLRSHKGSTTRAISYRYINDTTVQIMPVK